MLVQAVMWYFGMSQTEAVNYIKLLESQGQTSLLDEILRGYQNQCKIAFYCD